MRRVCLAVTNDIATDQRVRKVAGTLTHMGAHVTIAGRKKADTPQFDAGPVNIKLFRLPFRKGPLFYAVYNIRLFSYLLFSRFNLIVANDLDTLPGAFLAAWLRRVTLVYDSHELFTELPELQGRILVKKSWETLEKLFLPKVKFAYTVCHSLATYYQQRYGLAMGVVRNVPYNAPTKRQALFRLNPLGRTHILLYQGSVNLGRGLELMINTIPLLHGIQLFIIGDGDIIGSLKQMVIEKQLQERVVFTGRLLPEELEPITRQADIGISLEENIGLNYYYSLPNKLFDYIKAGLPLLVSDFPEMGALVKKYDIGKATRSRNPEEIALIITNMVEDKEQLSRWKNNLNKAAKELCWENEEKKLIELYSSLP